MEHKSHAIRTMRLRRPFCIVLLTIFVLFTSANSFGNTPPFKDEVKTTLTQLLTPQMRSRINAGLESLAAAKKFIQNSIEHAQQEGRAFEHLKADLKLVSDQAHALLELKKIYDHSLSSPDQPYYQLRDSDVSHIIKSIQKLGLVPYHLLFTLGQNPLLVPTHWQNILFQIKNDVPLMTAEQAASRLELLMGKDFQKITFIDFKNPISTGIHSQDYRARMRLDNSITDRSTETSVIIRIKGPNISHTRRQQGSSTRAALYALKALPILPESTPAQANSRILDTVLTGFNHIHTTTVQTENTFDVEAANLMNFEADFPGSKKWTLPKIHGLYGPHGKSISNPDKNNFAPIQSEIMILQDLGESTVWDVANTSPQTKELRVLLDRFISTLLFQVFITQKIHSEMHMHHLIHNPRGPMGMIGINRVLDMDTDVMKTLSKMYLAILRGDSDSLVQSLMSHGDYPAKLDGRILKSDVSNILKEYQFPRLSLWQSVKQTPMLIDPETHARAIKTIADSIFVLIKKHGLVLDHRYLDHYVVLLSTVGTLGNLVINLPKNQIRNSFVSQTLKFTPKALWHKFSHRPLSTQSCQHFYKR